MRAPHTGSLKLGDLSFACAVLPGGRQVLACDDVERVLGLRDAPPDSAWAELAGQWIHSSAVRYKPARGAAPVAGVELAHLASACRGWMKDPAAPVAQGGVRALARVLDTLDVASLIDEATGHRESRERVALHAVLEHHLASEHVRWAKSLPEEFYRKLFRLRGLHYEPSRVRRPAFVGRDTSNILFERLDADAPPEAATEADRSPTSRRFDFQHARYGWPALKTHVQKVMFLMDASGDDSWTRFQVMLNRAAPRLRTVPLPDSPSGD
jgi:hypothetical protein